MNEERKKKEREDRNSTLENLVPLAFFPFSMEISSNANNFAEYFNVSFTWESKPKTMNLHTFLAKSSSKKKIWQETRKQNLTEKEDMAKKKLHRTK